MELLRKYIGLVRDHYEKAVLIVAVLGLGVVVWVLNGIRTSEIAKVREYLVGVDRTPKKPLGKIDWTEHEAAIKAAEQEISLDFALPHNLVNPVTWQRQLNGDLIKIETGGEVGPSVMKLMEIRPLKFILSLNRATGSGGYHFALIREITANPNYPRSPYNPRPMGLYVTEGATNQFFKLLEVKGEPAAPAELVVELSDTGEKVSVMPDKPYTRIEGHEADLQYPPEALEFKNKREGSVIHFAGESYKIVAINADEVVLSANSNDKKYRVRP